MSKITATKGLLINWYLSRPSIAFIYGVCTSDASVREILLKLNSTMHFIIEDLDSNHLFIDAAQLDRVNAELSKRLAENIYLPPDSVK